MKVYLRDQMQLAGVKRPQLKKNIKIAENWEEHQVDRMTQSHLSSVSKVEYAQSMKKLNDIEYRDKAIKQSNRWSEFRIQRVQAIEQYVLVKTQMTQVIKTIKLIFLKQILKLLVKKFKYLINRRLRERKVYNSVTRIKGRLRKYIKIKHGKLSTIESRLHIEIINSVTFCGRNLIDVARQNATKNFIVEFLSDTAIRYQLAEKLIIFVKQIGILQRRLKDKLTIEHARFQFLKRYWRNQFELYQIYLIHSKNPDNKEKLRKIYQFVNP